MIHLLAIPGVILLVVVLWDAFESMVLPRGVDRRRRLMRYFYRWSWLPYRRIGRRIRREDTRERILSYYGPLAVIALLGAWAALLMFGFALLYRAVPLTGNFGKEMYFSGTTFVTLGLGDIAATSSWGRAITVFEAATGFGLLALIIGYLPVLYGAFSRRELAISQMDARAGSPPTAGSFFARFPPGERQDEIDRLMRTWEEWCAQVLESHISYPQLAYFRSQHDHQSWVAALTVVLDTSGLLVVLGGETRGTPAHLTFAMARHTAMDLSQLFGGPLEGPMRELDDDDLARLHAILGPAWPEGETNEAIARRLDGMRRKYEPALARLSWWLLMDLPPWLPHGALVEEWQTGLGH
jgi:hypothetical protein